MKRFQMIKSLKNLALLLMAGVMALSLVSCKKEKPTVKETFETLPNGTQTVGRTIEYNGKKYRYNEDLINILFLGIDTTDTLDKFSEPANAGQSDAIFILSLNKATKEASILQINRNAMTEIDIYNKSGQVIKSVDAQVTLQYAYGTGGTQSCWASSNTISKMLYDLPIDGYFTMNISGINRINDAIGGVDVEMPCDYTVIDSSMTAGSVVHIEGNLAERFVRYRSKEFNSVKDRMERQVLYITALMDKLCDRNTSEIYNIISPYLDDVIITNLSVDELNSLGDYTYSGCEVRLLPGEMIDTEQFEEYILDDEALKKQIIDTYYLEN